MGLGMGLNCGHDRKIDTLFTCTAVRGHLASLWRDGNYNISSSGGINYYGGPQQIGPHIVGKIGEDLGFCVYRRSYLLRSPVIALGHTARNFFCELDANRTFVTMVGIFQIEMDCMRKYQRKKSYLTQHEPKPTLWKISRNFLGMEIQGGAGVEYQPLLPKMGQVVDTTTTGDHS